MLSEGAKIGEEEREGHTRQGAEGDRAWAGDAAEKSRKTKGNKWWWWRGRPKGTPVFSVLVCSVGCVNAAWRLERSHRLDRGGRGEDGGAHKQRGHRWRRHQLRGVRLHRRL
jgi:hypothetical protein